MKTSIKKKILIGISFVLVSVIFFAGCTSSIPQQISANNDEVRNETPVPTSDVAEIEISTEGPAPEPLHMVIEPSDGMLENVKAMIESFKKAEPEMTAPLDDIPVYYEEELVDNAPIMILDYIQEACLYYGSGTMGSLKETIMCYPGCAFRKCSDDHGYLVYDTETGLRVFIFTDKLRGYSARMGMPIIAESGRDLKYSDFSELAIGDTIADVCRIDPVGEIYYRLLERYADDREAFNKKCDNGHAYSSIHYLSDGILKIEYVVNEDQVIEIHNIIYSEDYTLMDPSGFTSNYRILDIDLP